MHEADTSGLKRSSNGSDGHTVLHPNDKHADTQVSPKVTPPAHKCRLHEKLRDLFPLKGRRTRQSHNTQHFPCALGNKKVMVSVLVTRNPRKTCADSRGVLKAGVEPKIFPHLDTFRGEPHQSVSGAFIISLS